MAEFTDWFLNTFIRVSGGFAQVYLATVFICILLCIKSAFKKQKGEELKWPITQFVLGGLLTGWFILLITY